MTVSVEKVRVELGPRSYTVHVGRGLLGRLEAFLERPCWRKAAIVTDSRVGPLYAAGVEGGLQAVGLETTVLEVPAGEASKSAERALEIIDSMISFGLARSDAVIALGGGVVGDLAGFTASVYQRGVDVVQVPTSLMAQVDSSIGGKTAVNTPAAKNQVGTIHQPVAVICDVTLLDTLSRRELRSGFAEVAKYSVLSGRYWGKEFARDAAAAMEFDPERLARTVADCAREKAELVSSDERDYGVRHLLNYGHTLGHALEAAGGYGVAYTHGEAVSIGMVFAAIVAEEMKVAVQGLAGRHRKLLSSLGLPVRPFDPAPSFGDVAAPMAHDKKRTGGNTMVLLEREGMPLVEEHVDSALLERCYYRLTGGE